MMLLIFHYTYVDTGTNLADIISDQLLDGATKYSSPDYNITFNGSELYTGNSTVLLPEDIYHINFAGILYKYSPTPQSILLPDEIIKRKDFNIHNITIDKEELLPEPLYFFAEIF